MNIFFFILGRNPALSRAEIFSRFKLESIAFRLQRATEISLLLELNDAFSAPQFLSRLGGTIKIGKVITSLATAQLSSALTNESNINQFFRLSDRVVFGLSYYGKYPGLGLSRLKSLGLALKKKIVAAGVSARWVPSRENALSSVIVGKNKLIENGAEIVLIDTEQGQLVLGKTLAVQGFADYSQRDYGRPNRSMAQGMLPPKLGQMIINLAQLPKKGVLLDPFCGSGTILQEAKLLGYDHLIGSDNNPKAVSSTQANLAWLTQIYRLAPAQLKLRTADISSLNQWLSPASIDAVVTEPFLGPTRLPHERRALERAFSEVKELYQTAFANFQRVLKPGGRVVVIFPCWRLKQGMFRLSPAFVPKAFQLVTYPEWIGCQPFVYQREHQNVIREIFVFEKEKGVRP